MLCKVPAWPCVLLCHCGSVPSPTSHLILKVAVPPPNRSRFTLAAPLYAACTTQIYEEEAPRSDKATTRQGDFGSLLMKKICASSRAAAFPPCTTSQAQ